MPCLWCFLTQKSLTDAEVTQIHVDTFVAQVCANLFIHGAPVKKSDTVLPICNPNTPMSRRESHPAICEASYLEVGILAAEITGQALIQQEGRGGLWGRGICATRQKSW